MIRTSIMSFVISTPPSIAQKSTCAAFGANKAFADGAAPNLPAFAIKKSRAMHSITLKQFESHSTRVLLTRSPLLFM